MIQDRIGNDYFEWLSDIVCRDRFSPHISFRKLLRCLHSIEFTYMLDKDSNRAADGMELRYRFAYDYAGIEDAERYLTGPCSVLEMLVGLCIRCEETIMDDPQLGDRTGQWFWGMIVNLGLGSMTDQMFDRRYIEQQVSIFLKRRYRPNGEGGLFTIRDASRDLRNVEIWHQLLWYLDRLM